MQKYLGRISGPVFDRFQIMVVADRFSDKPQIEAHSLKEMVKATRQFTLEQRAQDFSNSRLSTEATYKNAR